MQPFLGPAALFLVALAAISLNAWYRLYRVVRAEKPEWLRYEGEPSLFFEGMPRVTDPNVNLLVLGIAFTGKVHELGAAEGLRHARTIRFSLPAFLIVFGCMLVYGLVGNAA